MELGKEFRKFLRDMFGSRYTEHMEVELLRLRQDFDVRIQEYKNSVAELRAEKSLLNAKIIMYEQNINARVGIDPTRKKPEKPSFASFVSPQVKTSWQAQVEKHEEQIAKELEEEEAAAMAN
jgi:hypothetical protein